MDILKALAHLGGSASLTQGGLVSQNPATQHHLRGPECIRMDGSVCPAVMRKAAGISAAMDHAVA